MTITAQDGIYTATMRYSCPLAGLQIEGDRMSIGDLNLEKLDMNQWGAIEKEVVFNEWQALYPQIQAVFVHHEIGSDMDPDVEIERLDHLIRTLVSALRIHKYGLVHDPRFTIRFLRRGVHTHRLVGPYRDEYLTSIQDGLVYRLAEEEVEQVDRICRSLAALKDDVEASPILATINSFDLSFLPTLSSRFKLSILYTALEMLFAVSPRSFEGERSERSSVYQRAFAAIVKEHGPIAETDVWYRFYCGSDNEELEIHRIRKIVHHLKVYDALTHPGQAVIFLQESVRIGIRLWIDAHLHVDRSDHRADHPLSSPRYSTKERMNIALHRLWNEDRHSKENNRIPKSKIT